MGVILESYRAAIGLFNNNCVYATISSFVFTLYSVLNTVLCLHIAALLSIFFIICFDVLLNPGPFKNFSLCIGHLNVRSLNIADKFEEVATIIKDKKFDIFGLAETLLNNSIPSESFSIPGYCPLIHLDRRDGRRVGDVALYVSDSLATKRRQDLETSDLELLWIEMNLNTINIISGVCYRPPHNHFESNISFLENLQLYVDKIYSKPGSLVVLGDFNAHYDPLNPSENSDFGIMFYRWLGCNNLCQVINEPTRITQHTATRLDLIITNSTGYFVNSGTLSPPVNCDHSLIFADLNIALSKPKCYKRFNWMFNRLSEADIKELYSDLSNIDWDEKVFYLSDVNKAYEDWFAIFRKVIHANIPNRIVTIRPRDKP